MLNNMAARTEAEVEGVFGQFHSRCGGKVELSEGRRVASGPPYPPTNPPPIAFSSAPIPRGLKFSVKVLQKNQTYDVSPKYHSESLQSAVYDLLGQRTHDSSQPTTRLMSVRCKPISLAYISCYSLA